MTVANLQRAQSALQFARQTAQNEIKRKEKEVERIMERWNKLSNEQSKLSNAPSGMRCANLAADSGVVIPRVRELLQFSLVHLLMLPRGLFQGDSVLENSLTELKSDRDHLVEQSESFRNVIISLATGLDRLIRQHKPPSTTCATPRPITDATLFPPSDVPWKEGPEHARSILNELLLATNSLIDARPAVPEIGHTSGSANPSDAKDSIAHQNLSEELRTVKIELGTNNCFFHIEMEYSSDACISFQRNVERRSKNRGMESSMHLSAINDYCAALRGYQQGRTCQCKPLLCFSPVSTYCMFADDF